MQSARVIREQAQAEMRFGVRVRHLAPAPGGRMAVVAGDGRAEGVFDAVVPTPFKRRSISIMLSRDT